MWAATRLSLTSAVCEPVKSILKIVAKNVMAVIASFRLNVAVPNDAGLGAPAMSVGFVGGFSWELVRVADKTVFAYPLVAMNRSMRGMNRIACSRNMTGLLLEGWTRFGDPISSCRRRQVSPKQHSLDVCRIWGPPND